MFIDEPGLEGGVEDGGGHSAQQATHHQDPEVVEVLSTAKTEDEEDYNQEFLMFLYGMCLDDERYLDNV